MSKANKSTRNKVAGGMNWWQYLNSKRPKGFRNTPQYLDRNSIKNRAKEIENYNKLAKERRKRENKTKKVKI